MDFCFHILDFLLLILNLGVQRYNFFLNLPNFFAKILAFVEKNDEICTPSKMKNQK